MHLRVRSGSLLYQHTRSGLPAVNFSLFFYLSKYHLRRNDAPPGGVLCDSHLNFAIQDTNKLEIVFGSPYITANNNKHPWIWRFFGQLFC